MLTQNLCIQTQYFDLIFPMIQLRSTSTFWIHHANTGLPTIRHCNAYSEIYTRYELFVSLRVTHAVLLSLHWMSTSTPFFHISATLCSGTRCDERFLLLYFGTVIPMVENLLEEGMPIYFSMDLSKHVLCYCIGSKWIFVPVFVLYLIHPCIQDWIIVGSTDWYPVLVPQTLHHFSKVRPISISWYFQLYV